MITIQNGKFTIPENERFIGFAGDNLRKKIEFLVKDEASASDIYRLYLTFDDSSVNFFVLPSVMTSEGVLITWNVLESHIFKSGIVKAQVKAFADNGVIWHTNQDTFIVGKTSEFPSSPDQMKNTEFLEYEKALNKILREIKTETTHPPYIGENGNWFLFDGESGEYYDSERPSAGEFQITEGYIDESMLSDESVTSDKLCDKSVTSQKLDRQYWEYVYRNPVRTYSDLDDILNSIDVNRIYRLYIGGLSIIRTIVGEGVFLAHLGDDNKLYIQNIAKGDVWRYEAHSEMLEKMNESLTPLFADSLEDCTDTTKLYVLPDGYLYAYMTSKKYPDITVSAESGYVFLGSGEKIAESTMASKYTNIFPVTPGDILKYTGKGLWSAVSVLWYNSDGGVVSSAVYNDNNNVTTVEVTVPDNVSQARFVSTNANPDVNLVTLELAWVLCQGDAATKWMNTGHAFVPADYEDRIIELEEKVSQVKPASPLKGKKIVYDGDSICADHDYNGGAYAKLIADKVGGTYVNQAVGGARLVTLADGSSYHSIVDNLENLPKDGDLYCFDGGMNDLWTHGNLGDFDYTNFTGELDKTTVCGALETIFRYCLDNFAGKPVCFVIVHKCQSAAYAENPYGHSFADYRNKIIGICEKYSIPYYDAFAKSGLNGWNTTQNAAYLTANSEGTPDGCHPNGEGYKKYYVPQLISLFESIMPVD